MNIILLVAIFAAFYNIKFVPYNKNYLSKKQTDNLKGIFLILVIFHHLRIFGGLGDVFEQFSNAGYLAVGGFLFISGFGLMVQYLCRGSNYIKTFPKKRLLTILFPAIIMGLIYFVVKNRIYGYSLHNLKMDFLRGSSVISNGWYVTAIIYFYIMFFVSALIAEIVHKRKIALIGIILATGLYLVLCNTLHYEGHWYSPSLCFAYGTFWACFKQKIETKKLKGVITIILCLFAIYYLLVPSLHIEYGWAEFKCLMYITLIVILGMRVVLNSKIMEWLGSVSYEVYLVHGLFFTLLRNNYVNISNGFTFACSLFILTFICAFILHKMFVRFFELLKLK